MGRTGETAGRAGAGLAELVERPWRRALREDTVRPAEVVGPWDLAPLTRAVVDFSSVIADILVFGPLGTRVGGGGWEAEQVSEGK